MSKKAKKPLSQRISAAFDIPEGTIGRCSSVEAVGQREVCVGGCEGLLSYTEDEVVLMLCDGVLTVKGEDLGLRSFSGGRVCVSGRIYCIRYGDESEADHDR